MSVFFFKFLIELYYGNIHRYIIEQMMTNIEKMNIKESTFRILEVELNDAQKHIDKLNQEKTALNQNREK